jgi:5-methylcytosine-specific restriction endonuclease McrA
VKAAVIEEMGGKCLLCGLKYHPDVYDFHHIFDKDSNVSDLLHHFKLWELSVELSKCVLLCANCHRAEHAATRVPS